MRYGTYGSTKLASVGLIKLAARVTSVSDGPDLRVTVRNLRIDDYGFRTSGFAPFTNYDTSMSLAQNCRPV